MPPAPVLIQMLKAHTMLCRGEKRGVHTGKLAVLDSQLTAVAVRPSGRLDQAGWIRSLSCPDLHN